MEPAGKLIASGQASVRTYREDGFQAIPRVFLEDGEYERGIQRFVNACADVVVINSAERTIYLARRRSKPCIGWWWFGGAMQINETPLEAAIRSFKREAGITLEPERLTLKNVSDYFWKDRQQEPQNIGRHDIGYEFTVDSPAEEIAQIKLEPNEFDAGAGIRAFKRNDLVRENVFPAILDLYDDVFPPIETPTFGELRLASKDERRAIWEFNGEDFASQLFEVYASNLPLGKHAHAKKFEVFTILKGGGLLLTAVIDPQNPKLETVRMRLEEGSVIKLPPFVAHTFYLQPGSKMHCYSSQKFDPTDFINTPWLIL